jgi:hypothetical protein
MRRRGRGPNKVAEDRLDERRRDDVGIFVAEQPVLTGLIH